MLTQAIFVCAAIVGQCQDCQPMYGNGLLPKHWDNGTGMVAHHTFPDGLITIIYRDPHIDRLDQSFIIYYQNIPTIERKEYAKAQVRIGTQSHLIYIPIINGLAPTIRWNQNKNNSIISLTCDYKDRYVYKGGTITYSKTTTSKTK